MKRPLAILEIIVIMAFAIVPLLFTLPYRVNIFLSWEGAYRISNGQIPFRDFGIPLGGMYWAVPAIFFKIFGSQMITLIKAQVFINIISGLAFRSILKTLQVNEGVRLASVLLYCISFSFINFWPWYNHSVIVYAFIALAFAIKAIMIEKNRQKQLFSLLAAVFTFFAFFTKQDGGGLIFLICSILFLYSVWLEKKWQYFLLYVGGTAVFISAAVLYFSRYDFSYWFNHGHPPHNARVSAGDMLNIFFGDSQWLKFYFFIILLIALPALKQWKDFIRNKRDVIFLLMTLGVLCMAAIFQVTSYTPDNSNIFFHSFAFAFFFSALLTVLPVQVNLFKISAVLSIGVMLWWSQLYWNYMQRILRINESTGAMATSATGEDIVDMHNAAIKTASIAIPQGNWVGTNVKTLHKITVPEPTAKGIDRMLNLDVFRNKKDVRVLNMSELTFLAAEIPYKLETGDKFPLWYHLGVGMFNREAKMFEDRIGEQYYDVVLFEYINTLNNFYPFRVRDSLQLHYNRVDSFFAPRNTNQGIIEVYLKK